MTLQQQGMLTQTEIDKLMNFDSNALLELPSADEKKAEKEIIKGLDNLTSTSKGSAIKTKAEVYPRLNLKRPFQEPDITYVCKECGGVMEQAVLWRQSGHHAPILSCLKCHYSVNRPRK